MARTTTVVVPVYRVSATVGASLESVAAQTVPATQVVLVDDRGGDDSIDVAIAAAERLRLPYEVVRHPRNAGLGAARNSGLARAEGEFVWFLDSDDAAEPAFLAELLPAVTATDADFAICRTQRVDPSGAELGVVENTYWRRVCPGVDLARELLRGRLRAYACNKLFRTALLDSAPFPAGQAYEDFVPVLSLALQARRVAVSNRPLYRYRSVPDSISNRFGAHTLDLLTVSAQVDDLFAGRPDAAEFADDLLVHRYLQVLLPIANMALRSEMAQGADSLTRTAVAEVRRRIRPADLARLTMIGQFRLAATAATLGMSRRAYAAALGRR